MGLQLSVAVNNRLKEIDLNQQSTISIQDARLFFSKFDKDSNGVLDQVEGRKFLKEYLSAQKQPTDDNKINQLFTKLDLNGGKK